MYADLVVGSRTLFFQRRPAVTLNGIDPDDVSFRIGSPHRAEASLCMTRFWYVRGHISSKKGPPWGGGLRRFVVGY